MCCRWHLDVHRDLFRVRGVDELIGSRGEVCFPEPIHILHGPLGTQWQPQVATIGNTWTLQLHLFLLFCEKAEICAVSSKKRCSVRESALSLCCGRESRLLVGRSRLLHPGLAQIYQQNAKSAPRHKNVPFPKSSFREQVEQRNTLDLGRSRCDYDLVSPTEATNPGIAKLKNNSNNNSIWKTTYLGRSENLIFKNSNNSNKHRHNSETTQLSTQPQTQVGGSSSRLIVFSELKAGCSCVCF